MLDTTLTTEFVPGTNVKGEVAGANWLFLLPDFALDRVVCFGLVAPASLAAVARMAGEVLVLAEGESISREVAEISHKYRLFNVRMVQGASVLPDGSASLVLVTDEALRSLARDPIAVAELQRVLQPEGLLYFEHNGVLGREDAIRRLSAVLGEAQRFWLTPLGGEMHTAVPDQDKATIEYFLRHGLTSRSVNLSALKHAVRANLQPQARGGAAPGPQGPTAAPRGKSKRGLKTRAKRAVRTTLASLFNTVQGAFDGAEQQLIGSTLLGGVARRYGVLVGGAPSRLTEQPPRYLREIASAAGVDIAHHRWGLSARGEYSSRKVLVFLFNHADETPEYIVKMTRDRALNPRLENEHRALALLAEMGVGDRETLPQVAFFGHHNHLAVLGETIVDGVPFERRASAAADCVYAHDAIRWLTELGAKTADRAGATPADVAAGLGSLLRRFVEIYRLTETEQAFLEAQVATLGESRSAFPLVFQHGDPGTWNAVVTPAGHSAFLDWEAAEPQGMPLWDLFYFVRTYGAWSLRTAIAGDVTKGFVPQFLAPSPFQSMLVDATARYCARVGVPEQFVEPLFYTCWMHRALKESTRLSPHVLDRGHYVNVLRASIARRDDLHALFALAAAV
ncbi:MAG: phosphotransferase [Kouleothrix sp.]|nr:phosphotransferase [Kouleothrix sp.]